MTNARALDDYLLAHPAVSPLLATLARSLADVLDLTPPVSGYAAVAKEYRACIDRMLGDDRGDQPDPLALLFGTSSGAALGDAT